MGIISETVMIKIGSRNFQYYKELGYHFEHSGDEIEVKVEDLPKQTKTKICVQCDYCGVVKWIPYADYLKSFNRYYMYSCNKCTHYKSERTNFNKYGVLNYSSTLECRTKVKNSFLEHYGVDNGLKVKEIIDKIKNTNLKKYNCVNPMQSPEIRAKANETLCKNGNQKTSNQQLYLYNLYGGEINYPVSYYATDICFPEEKLVIEYDGGGHDLRVTLGVLTQEEFDQKEIIRNNIIKREGYKQMRIISSKDLLPSDTILLEMLSQAKEYFSKYPERSWIEFNIDSSTVRNAENKEGLYFDYRELRTIKEVA